MKKDIKEEIIETARTLFNEKGYNQVSMRNIADALGISVGNLTYHFRHKEDLVEAVVLHQHRNYRKFDAPVSLQELDAMFRRSLAHQRNNAYYFRHYVQWAQTSKRVYGIQQKVLGDMREALDTAFGNLIASGDVQAELVDKQRRSIVKSIMTLVIFGGAFIRQNRREALWGMIYPMLTEKGRATVDSEILQ